MHRHDDDDAPKDSCRGAAKAAHAYHLLEAAGKPAAQAETPRARRRTIKHALAAARLKYGVQRRSGNLVPYFLVYDMVVLIILGSYLVWVKVFNDRHGIPEWSFWVSCYYTKMIWGLFSFPYLIFLVPILGSALHSSKITGYDQSGQLVPKLTAALMRQKQREDKLREEMGGGVSANEGTAAAAVKVQKHYRGKRARKRVLRHLVYFATPAGFFVPADTIEKWF
jgi:hypothetical protein